MSGFAFNLFYTKKISKSNIDQFLLKNSYHSDFDGINSWEVKIDKYDNFTFHITYNEPYFYELKPDNYFQEVKRQVGVHLIGQIGFESFFHDSYVIKKDFKWLIKFMKFFNLYIEANKPIYSDFNDKPIKTTILDDGEIEIHFLLNSEHISRIIEKGEEEKFVYS